MSLPWVEAIARGEHEARIPAGRYASVRTAQVAAYNAAERRGFLVSVRALDDGSLAVRRRGTRPDPGAAQRLFGPLLDGLTVVVPPGRYASQAVAESKAHRFASRRGIAIRTRRQGDGSVAVSMIGRRGAVKRTRRKVTREPAIHAAAVFDPEADRLDELADLSFIALQHKWVSW